MVAVENPREWALIGCGGICRCGNSPSSLRGECFLYRAILLSADESGGIRRGDRVFFHHSVSLPQFAGNLAGVHPQSKRNRVIEDVTLEIKAVVENMPATAPAVFDLGWDAVLVGNQGVLGQSVQERLFDGLWLIADDGKTTHGE